MRHLYNIYGIVTGALLFAMAVTGCVADDEQLTPDSGTTTEMTLLVRKPSSSRAQATPDLSTDAGIIEFLRTLNGEFEVGDKIRLVNTLDDRAPNFTEWKTTTIGGNNGYFEYYCIENDTTSDGFYRFKPTTSRALKWTDTPEPYNKDAIYTNSRNYTFDALFYKTSTLFNNISTGERSVSGYVQEDQSSPENFLASDVMHAHHLIPSSSKGTVIKLRFWHQMAMVVINVSVPAETFGVGFNWAQMRAADCKLTNFYRSFSLNYVHVDSDKGIPTSILGEERSDIQMCPVGDPRSQTGTDGTLQWVRTFAALVPEQRKTDGSHFCRFGIDGKGYVYNPNGDVEMMASRMTIIDLHINPEKDDPILISSRILPWDYAHTDWFPLYPEKEINE